MGSENFCCGGAQLQVQATLAAASLPATQLQSGLPHTAELVCGSRVAMHAHFNFLCRCPWECAILTGLMQSNNRKANTDTLIA